ncbi:MAG TPA: OmpH family outer membrane protein [Taishania sp.]|nr:OmpH family outer membrane protein [Taishania sp.]
MKKLLYLATVAVVAVACNSGKKTDSKDDKAVVAEATPIKDGIKIAYYVLDSVAEHFEVYKKELDVFEKEGAKLQGQLESMQKEYQNVYSAYEDGARKQVLTPNQMANYEQRLGAIQQRMADFQNTKMVDFQKKQMDATTAIQNKITNYSAEFSKENGIDLFLITGTGSQIAYGNAALDMTEKFVDYMNKKEAELNK